MKKQSILIVMVLLLAGCGSGGTSGGAQDVLAADVQLSAVEEMPAAEYRPPYFREPKTSEQKPAADLGIDQAAIQEEMRAVAWQCRELLMNSEQAVSTADGIYFILTDDEKQALFAAIEQMGCATADSRMDTLHAEQLRDFYAAYEARADAAVSVYTFLGTLNRLDFICKGGTVYSSISAIHWDSQMQPVLEPAIYFSELEVFERTPKGFLFYGSRQASTLHVRTLSALRIEPLGDECRRICRIYVDPLLSYAATGVFSSDWDAESIERVGLNDAFEFLYQNEHGMAFDQVYTESFYENGVFPLAVPAEDFEAVILKYFPVTREKLCELAVYDPLRQVYAAEPWIHPDASPDWEVVDVSRGADGLLTLTMDAVSPENLLERSATNTVVIQLNDDGSYRYLSNRLQRFDEGVQSRVPAFQEYSARVG